MKKLYLFIIIALLFFGFYYTTQYAPDTYTVFSKQEGIVPHFLSCGRVVTGAFIYILTSILHASNRGIYIVSYILAVVCTIASMYKLYKLFKEDIDKESISVIAAILIVLNPFSIELFMYIEKGILMLSVLLCVLAVEQIKRFLEGNKKGLLFALIYMIIANCCYQGTVGLFVAISLLYIIKYSKNIREFIINNIVVALVYGIPAILNFIMVRFIFTNTRVNGQIILTESISKIIAGTKRMFIETHGLLPRYLFLAIIILTLVFIIYKALRKKQDTTTKVLEILGAVYIIVGTTFATIAPQILQDTQSIWFVARSTYPVAAIIGLLVAYVFMRFEIKDITKGIILIATCLFLLVQYMYFIEMTTDNYIVNYTDKQNAEQIKKQILEYEEETGNTITKIAIYKDKYPEYTYPKMKASGDMNLKAFYSEWATIDIMNYYTNRDLEQVMLDEEIQEEYSKKNWDYYSNELVILQGDIIHLCNY